MYNIIYFASNRFSEKGNSSSAGRRTAIFRTRGIPRLEKYANEKGQPGCGSAWLERLVWDQEVAGSNPVTPILKQFPAGVVQW